MKNVQAVVSIANQPVLFPGQTAGGYVVSLMKDGSEEQRQTFTAGAPPSTVTFEGLVPGDYSIVAQRMLSDNSGTVGAPAVANFTVTEGGGEMGMAEVPVSISVTVFVPA